MKRNLDDRQFTAWIREVDIRLGGEEGKKERGRRRDGGESRMAHHHWRDGNGTTFRERKCFAVEDAESNER